MERLNFETAIQDGSERIKHAVASQNILRHTIASAESIGMKVNVEKTHLLVVSDAISYTPRSYIMDSGGSRLTSGDSMKILGFHFSSKPGVSAHVQALRKRFRQKYWILFHLKNFGFSKEELAKVYRTIILPTADYCSVVYHSLLTD